MMKRSLGSDGSSRTPSGALLACIFALVPLIGASQWTARAELDTNRIRIGEQPTLTLSLEYQGKDKKIRIPAIKESLGEKIELIEMGPVDTVIPHEDKAPELRRLVQKLRITSFDTGLHKISPFHFRVNGDTISTETRILEVRSVELGKKPEAKPIKGIHRFPYTWKAWLKDHWPWLAGGAALLALAIFLLLYFRKRKKREGKEVEIPSRPPHERALEALRKMEAEKSYREQEPKAYYSELTDILRQYLEERYRIPALEETTGKILQELAFTEIDEEGKNAIGKILRTADMAKFAKQRPGIPEKEEALKESIAFVENSVPLAEESEETEKNATKE